MGKQLSPDALLFSALFNERGVLASLVVTQVMAIILAFAPNAGGDIWLHLGEISLFLHVTVLVSTSFFISLPSISCKTDSVYSDQFFYCFI